MDLCANRIRIRALQALCKAVKPSLPLSFVARDLGFETEADAAALLRSCGGVLVDKDDAPADGAAAAGPPRRVPHLDTKVSVIVEVRQATQEEKEFQSAGLKALATLKDAAM